MPPDGQNDLDLNQSISLSSLNQWCAGAPSFQLEFCFRKCPLGKKKRKCPLGLPWRPDGYDFRGRGAGCIPDEEPHDQTAKNIKQSDSVFFNGPH